MFFNVTVFLKYASLKLLRTIYVVYGMCLSSQTHRSIYTPTHTYTFIAYIGIYY